MVRSPPVMSPSTATQMDSKMPNQGKPGSTGSQSQPSPCDPKSLGTKGAQNVAGGMGLKNGQGLTSGPSSKVKVKRERSTSVESFDQPESGTPTNEEKGNKHSNHYLIIWSWGHKLTNSPCDMLQVSLVTLKVSQYIFKSPRLFEIFFYYSHQSEKIFELR